MEIKKDVKIRSTIFAVIATEALRDLALRLTDLRFFAKALLLSD